MSGVYPDVALGRRNVVHEVDLAFAGLKLKFLETLGGFRDVPLGCIAAGAKGRTGYRKKLLQSGVASFHVVCSVGRPDLGRNFLEIVSWSPEGSHNLVVT